MAKQPKLQPRPLLYRFHIYPEKRTAGRAVRFSFPPKRCRAAGKFPAALRFSSVFLQAAPTAPRNRLFLQPPMLPGALAAVLPGGKLIQALKGGCKLALVGVAQQLGNLRNGQVAGAQHQGGVFHPHPAHILLYRAAKHRFKVAFQRRRAD